MGALGNTELREAATDAGRPHGPLGSAGPFLRRAGGGEGTTDRMQLAEWVLDRVGDRAEADVRINGGPSSLTRFANSFIHQNVGEDADTVALRVASASRVASGTTTYLDPDALGELR